ncbi:hypothetical protein Vadar_021470 [Vaccinium darrowii]|uniref:Uncharacterized protein n=1 Tax=Vaccinium darrowii TaxID=229202 RepID=A0ACB7XBZ2_9ERIC|nr:hypothetical protein Vadar_021470 [Vaccinium darrowii]
MAPKRRQSATAAAGTEASINITTEAQTSPSAHSKRPRSQPQNVMDKERVDNLVEGFGKNFLVFLVMEAISKDHDFIHKVRQKADVDPAQRLVCVRTTDLSVTGEALKSFFEEYGEIEAFGTMSSFRTFSARILFKLRKDAWKAVYHPFSKDICLKKKIGNCFPYRVLFSRILPNRIFITENATEIPSFPSKIDVRGDEGEEPLMELVQSFGEDSLMDLVKEAIYKVPKFIKTVEKQADLDPVQRQIYISEGIGIDHEFQTHTDGAKEVLRSKGLEFYGKIQYCLITGEDAYVQFKHRKSVLKIMELPDEIARNGIKCARFTTLFRNPPKVH